MKIARDLLEELAVIGASIESAGDRLILRAGGTSIPADLVGRIRRAKTELLATLTIPAAVPAVWSETEEERAAITEYDGGAPRPWAEALARLDPARVPPNICQERWTQFIDDCGRFLDQGWAIRANGLGWGPLDLFGCDRERPPLDDDHAGLLWRVERGKLVMMSAYSAIIETVTGQEKTFHRRNNHSGELSLAWELAKD